MIKHILKALVHFGNGIYLNLNRSINIRGSRFFLTQIKGSRENQIRIENSDFDRTKIIISDSKNTVEIKNAVIGECNISINGTNNRIEIEEGVSLLKAIVIVRGDSNLIRIGKNSTFGQIRMINVGKENAIKIGEGCLFADNIELWASDTHSIYDKDGNFINQEKPIIIGDKVWVGSYVKILKGVEICEGSVIGMNSMVTKDIGAKTLNVGIPSRCVKENITWALKYENAL